MRRMCRMRLSRLSPHNEAGLEVYCQDVSPEAALLVGGKQWLIFSLNGMRRVARVAPMKFTDRAKYFMVMDNIHLIIALLRIWSFALRFNRDCELIAESGEEQWV